MRMISQQLREEARDDTLPAEFQGRALQRRGGPAVDSVTRTRSDPLDALDVRLVDGRAHVEV